MKLAILLLCAASAWAESKTEKQLRVQVAELTQRLDVLTVERNRLVTEERAAEARLQVQATTISQQADILTRHCEIKTTPPATAVKKIVSAQMKTLGALDRNAQLTRDAIHGIDDAGEKSETAVKVARDENKATLKTLGEVTQNQKATLRILVVLAGCVAGLIVIVFMLAKGRSSCHTTTQI